MKIKTTVRYLLTPVRIKKKKTTKNNKCCQGCGEKGSLVHYWWKYKLVQSVWKTVWVFLKNVKKELPYHPAISYLGIYPKKTKI